ncbi:MAG TPA: M28 family peptidase [Acidobacteriota bacterium]|nr:M28 family peptidase [Acidobacteriota bacterium]
MRHASPVPVIATLMILMLTGFAGAGELAPERQLSRDEMRAVVQFLASDLLEGRAPGTRGGELAEAYLESLFQLLGLQPGQGAGYRQTFALKGFQTHDTEARCGDIALEPGRDYMLAYLRDEARFQFDTEAAFVGFGISAPDYDWDDFKDADVRGKLLFVRVNDPGLFEPARFNGRQMTYFGRWRYKVEEAARRGAAGVLLIHTDATAGYGWDVVRHSWSGEEICLPADLENNLRLRGWITETALRRVLSREGLDLDALCQRSLRPDFRPVPLRNRFILTGRNSFRQFQTSNIIGEIPGRTGRRIVVSAHIDHLGMARTETGDRIYNGAVDNGSAVATLVLVAKRLAERSEPLRHTIAFLACQAEEAGLLGTRYYVDHADTAAIVANLNLESVPVREAARDFHGIGAEHSTLGELLRDVLAAEGLAMTRSFLEEQGFFFRSDQFAFALRGIPAIMLMPGTDYPSGVNHQAEYFRLRYHTVEDAFRPEWELDGVRQAVQVTVRMIEALDRAEEAPVMKPVKVFPITPRKQRID